MADDEEMKKAFPLTQILPEPVKKRVNALKNLQLETLKLEASFFIEVYKLEYEYHQRMKAIYDKREKIISGTVEPTEEECKLNNAIQENEPDPESASLIKELREKLEICKLIEEGYKGIPEFWLTIFKNVEITNDMIQPHDEPILKFLTDVQLEINSLSVENMGFRLIFIFADNPYFTNSSLTKEYVMKCAPDDSDPWSFEGPEIYKCKGCTIDWKKSMNVTLKTIRKRQRHKSRGAVRTVVKYVQNDSFFNFFNPPSVPDGGEMDEETQALLTSDFEIGHYIKDKIIPHAVLYYTGEALEDEEFDDEDESSESDFDNDDDDDDEEDDDDDDGESDGDAPHNEPAEVKSKTKLKKKNENAQQQQQECTQQ
uniref:Nucleosome assembly protein n=1 Tax=Riptortus pedestris TaxID=329032 RepID=R4WD41_RIPPE|nr:nucleosome assembly protein [Riptortus pedestris]